MKVLVLHSEVPPDAPPEDRDTLIAAEAIAEALASRGHAAPLAPFTDPDDEEPLRALIGREMPDVVFNMVEGIGGQGRLAYLAPRQLDIIGIPYTGTRAEALILTGDKPATKRLLRDNGLPTPDWSEPPAWEGLTTGRWIVKSADEDASVGLDDGCVVEAGAVAARADSCAERFGGRWFAEAFVDGREFNIAIIEEDGAPRVLPMAEMTFESWPADRPRIVGYTAKWHEGSHQSRNTVRKFGVEAREPALARELKALCKRTWTLFGCRGTARVDFRVDGQGRPLILEVNPNPGIAPDSGLVAAAAKAGLSYGDLIEGVVRESAPFASLRSAFPTLGGGAK
jgi:D-alanine-D-alanine ligase